MKSAIVFFVFVAAACARHLEDGGQGDSVKRENIHNLLTMPADHLVFCTRDKDCEHDLQAPICDLTMRLCKPRNAPSIEYICKRKSDHRKFYWHHTLSFSLMQLGSKNGQFFFQGSI